MKIKKCRVCKGEFKPFQMQVVCSPICAIALAKKKISDKKAKENRKDLREYNLKDRGKQRAKAQMLFNKYIRLRDKNDLCISCRNPNFNGQYHAGHFKTVGGNSQDLAFNEDNCHKQCSACNNHKSGDILNYRKNLLLKIGEERVTSIEKYHPPVKFTLEDFISIQKKYTNKIKLLSSN